MKSLVATAYCLVVWFLGFTWGREYERQHFAWPVTEADYQKAVVCDLHPAIGLYADEAGAHVHCPEELNGGGYRNGKFVYLKDVAQ